MTKAVMMGRKWLRYKRAWNPTLVSVGCSGVLPGGAASRLRPEKH